MKRPWFLLACLVMTAPAPALAQTTPDGGSNLVLGNAPPPAPGSQTCVQVNITGQKPSPYSCLNQQLQSQVQSGAPALSIPLGANSPANAVGSFNRAGVAEQYGQNFGKSVIPYRPPTPNFSGGVP